jgi:hypothetical protein
VSPASPTQLFRRPVTPHGWPAVGVPAPEGRRDDPASGDTAGVRWLAGVLAVLLLVLVAATGCSGPRPPVPDLTAEVVVGRAGGVAGLRELLRVRPDGVALQVGGSAGRLDADRLAALRSRLADPALRDEAAAAARSGDDDARCSDLITRSLTVGTFAMSVTEPCGNGRRPRTPVFDAVLDLLGDASSGRFDQDLRSGDVPRVTLRTERGGRTSGGDGPYVVTADPDGSLTLARPGAPDRQARLDDKTRDALALTGAGLLGQAATACPGSGGATVEVVAPDGRRVSGTACSFGARTVDAIAVHRALTAPFDLD